jgi:hypothetical protein
VGRGQPREIAFHWVLQSVERVAPAIAQREAFELAEEQRFTEARQHLAV